MLFPLCRQLDVVDQLPAMHCGSVGNPIEVMIREHEHTGDALVSQTVLVTCSAPFPQPL